MYPLYNIPCTADIKYSKSSVMYFHFSIKYVHIHLHIYSDINGRKENKVLCDSLSSAKVCAIPRIRQYLFSASISLLPCIRLILSALNKISPHIALPVMHKFCSCRVCYLAREFIRYLNEDRRKWFNQEEEKCVGLAGLCHDLGISYN